MSSANFEQLREQLLRLPPDVRQTLKAALELETEEQQKLLEELPELRQLEPHEVKVRRVSPRDFSREIKWLKEHAHLYPGEHLAVNGDQLLAHGASFGEVFDQAKTIRPDFLMHYQPKADDVWLGGFWL